MNVITNKDIIEFCAGKRTETEEVYQKTYLFEKEHRQSSGGYAALANTFFSNGFAGREDDKRFFEWLRKKEKENTIYQLRSLRPLEEDTSFDIFLKHANLNQKWHCLVAYYAYKEFEGK